MALVTTGHALCNGITDFFLPVADDGTMRNCATPARVGTLTGGAAYTTTMEAPLPDPFFTAAISFDGSSGQRVVATHALAFEPASYFSVCLGRGPDTANIEGIYHHKSAAGNDGISQALNGTAAPFEIYLVADGVASESFTPGLANDIWLALGATWGGGGQPNPSCLQIEFDAATAFNHHTSDFPFAGIGTPEELWIGTYRTGFVLNGLVACVIRWDHELTEAEMNDVLADARNGFALMLEDDAGAPAASGGLSGSPLSAPLLMSASYP